MISSDPSSSLLGGVGRALRWRPLTRRRLVRELEQHLDDAIADLQASGLPAEEARRQALRRLGDADTIVAAVRRTGASPGRSQAGRRLRSPAWIAVGAMSLVTALAAELPPASGAKATMHGALDQHHTGRSVSGARFACRWVLCPDRRP